MSDDASTATTDEPKRFAFLRRLGARYHHVRHNHRYGIVLRYVTIAVGTVVTVLGIFAIPYPGPGWALVFFGLLILSQELEWAARLRHRVMTWLSGLYAKYIDDSVPAKIALGVGTCAVVLASLWVTGGLDLMAGWVGVHSQALESPL